MSDLVLASPVHLSVDVRERMHAHVCPQACRNTRTYIHSCIFSLNAIFGWGPGLQIADPGTQA